MAKKDRTELSQAEKVRKQWKVSMGRRLQEERKRLRLSQTDITKRLGEYTKQLISHWEVGFSEIQSYDLLRLERLGFDVQYIVSGVYAGAAGPKLVLPRNFVPYPTSSEAIAIAAGKLDPSSIARVRPVFETIANGLAIDVMDGAMAPMLPAGKSTVVIDRARTPESGEVVVVALLATQEVLIRRLEERRGKKFVLKPDNKLFPDREVTEQHEPVIMGTMVLASISTTR